MFIKKIVKLFTKAFQIILINLMLLQKKKVYCFFFNIYSFIFNKKTKIYFKDNYYFVKNFNIRFSEKKIGFFNYMDGINNRISYLKKSYLISELNFEENDIIIDCGAQNGDFYLCFNKKIIYYGIEPSPITFSNLQHNVKNQNLLNKATWKTQEKNINFYLKDDFSDSSLIKINDFTNIIPVQTITLDGIIDQIICKIADVNNKKIKLIKIDAEGAEPEVLLGLSKNLINVHYITVDCSFERGVEKASTLAECVNYLLKNNFKIMDFSAQRTAVLFKNNSY
jgi:FkbM family methyltransferase